MEATVRPVSAIVKLGSGSLLIDVVLLEPAGEVTIKLTRMVAGSLLDKLSSTVKAWDRKHIRRRWDRGIFYSW